MKKVIAIVPMLLIAIAYQSPGQSPYGVEFQVNTYAEDYQCCPTLAKLSNGDLLVCWDSNGQDRSATGCYGQLFSSDGQKIGQEFQINTYTFGEQLDPRIAPLLDGGFAICWTSYDTHGLHYGIYGQVFTANGEKVGDELQVVAAADTIGAIPLIAPLSSGGFVVCWEITPQDLSDYGIYGQVFSPQGEKLGDQFEIDIDSNGAAVEACLASLSSGRFLVCWNNADEQGFEIYGQFFADNGQKMGSKFRVNTYTDDAQSNPVIATLKSADVAVCWISYGQDGSDSGLYAQLFSSTGERIGNEFQVNTFVKGHQLDPRIAPLANGGFAISWYCAEKDTFRKDLYGQMFSANGERIGDEFRINTYTESRQTSPVIAAFEKGGLVICWQSAGQDGSGLGVYGQLFTENGEKVQNEFQINSYAKNNQENPVVAPLEQGGFMCCWSSDGQDGSFAGIFAKCFPAAPVEHQLNPFSLLGPAEEDSLDTLNPSLAWRQPSNQMVCYSWELHYKAVVDTIPFFPSPTVIEQDRDTTLTLPTLHPGKTYFWKVLAKNISGDSLWSTNTNAFFILRDATKVEHKTTNQPSQFTLHQNYPNPFNPTTTISYELPNPGLVSVKVYDLTGRLVKALLSGSQAAGAQCVTWDGTDFNGNPVAAGIYIYQIEFTGVGGKKYTLSKKMSLVK